MGEQYTRSRYHHLYIDGVYWGVFMTQERVEEFYGETYFGGDQDDYDIVKSGLADGGGTRDLRGQRRRLAAAVRLRPGARRQSRPPTPTSTGRCRGSTPTARETRAAGAAGRRQPRRLHADHLLHGRIRHRASRGSSATTQANNWFGIYNRVAADQGFQFFIHDNEHSLGADVPGPRHRRTSTAPGRSTTATRTTIAQFNPQYLHQDLLAHPGVQAAVHRPRAEVHLQRRRDDARGEHRPASWSARAQVDPAIIAEAARWGDSKVATPLQQDHLAERDQLAGEHLFPVARQHGAQPAPHRRTVHDVCRADVQPARRHGAEQLSAHDRPSGAGTIYYTTDGVTDPRSIGGGVNPSAAVKLYTGSVPISGATTVMARLRTAGGQWSGLVEATFTTVTLRATTTATAASSRATTAFGSRALATRSCPAAGPTATAMAWSTRPTTRCGATILARRSGLGGGGGAVRGDEIHRRCER